jgi:hypothetical protein
MRIAGTLGLESGSAARAESTNVIAHFFRDKAAVEAGPVTVAVLPVEREKGGSAWSAV